jgi:hypothetical protein
LSLALGVEHPDFLLERLTSAQIAEWLAYYAIEPFGYRVDWLRTGVVASTIANASRARRSRKFAPEDFMPKEPDLGPPKKQTMEQLKDAVLKIYAMAKRNRLAKE